MSTAREGPLPAPADFYYVFYSARDRVMNDAVHGMHTNTLKIGYSPR